MADASMNFREDRKGRLKWNEQLDILRLAPKDKRRLVRMMASDVRKDARQNIRQQKTVSGAPMAPRKDARNKRKLLRRMGKPMVVFNKSNHEAVVSFKGRAGSIASKHQHGSSERMTATKAAKRAGTPDYNALANRDQAKSLIAEGYRLPVKGKRGRTKLKRVSQKWIRENMTIGQAGLILRLLRDDKGKQSWTITTPARPFLGADERDAQQMLDSLARTSLARLRAKGAR
ncbi:phage virion morphogenesis protein [Endozoicomonas sp. GU-1]|uniref:phage virion morphogenesis protein n=1 Tax=Endozoicomonas sp. GU-1 TaxID=3009078 RepID=UPI0022B39AFF|nr:phage virion morphogenesis protein [Endozoicomonas sp. GU-1]WBA86521.1 phage virion morphogenesis protein [Endozoicomonas sp. GU-1]